MKANNLINRFKLGAGVALVAATLTGCLVGGGGVDVGVAAPGPFWFGGFERGRDVHVYHDRGFASRGAAHAGFGHRR
jgi:hypothetical protein